MALVLLGVGEWRVLADWRQNVDAIQHTLAIRQALTELQATLTDAETGQRGYLVSGDEKFLEPYTLAKSQLGQELEHLRALATDRPALRDRTAQLAALVTGKMAELDATVALMQRGQAAEAARTLREGAGRRSMEGIRALLGEMRAQEQAAFDGQVNGYNRSVRQSLVVVIGGSAGQVLLMLVLALLSARDFRLRDMVLKRETFLRDAAVLLSSSLDYQQTLKQLAKLSVPAIADWCAIDMLDDSGDFSRVAVEHVDPAKVQLAHELLKKLPPDPNQPTGFFHVIRTGQPEFYPVIKPEMIDAALPDPELRATFHALGLRSSIAVPLIARGRAMGVLTLVNADSERHFTDFDLVTAQKLSRLAALAVDNARLFGELQESGRLKDEFLSTVSHELRTPLTAMLGWAQILNKTAPEPEKVAHAAEIIERNARAQAQLIEDLLDVSRIIAGKLRLDVRNLNLVKVIEGAVDAVQLAAEARQIRLQKLLDPQADAMVGDPDRLQQVFWNLLSNAIKFTPKGGRVTLQLARVNSHVEVTVADTGEGIPPEFLPHVFERFRQADASVKREHQGLGLGLAITKHLVELHGGTIHVSSPGHGQGATFVVKLPRFALRAEAPGEVAEHPTAHAPVAWSEPPELAGARILVVDDQADGAALLAELLGRCKAAVTTASSADQAEAILKAQDFDLLLSDIGMPRRDGYELIRSIRAWSDGRGELPAVAITAYARAEDRSRALRAGFDAHVAKPVEPGELVEVAGALLRRRPRR